MTETVSHAGEGSAPEPVTMTRPRAKPIADRPSRIYAVELPSFEGPLDLLLHLVRRHELEILDIPIAFITEKYLEYLDVMRALDIEILGDYLVMAATLAYLKSRELVPQQESEEEAADEDDEDGEDPREALIRRLIEYERFRAAGRELNCMPVIGRDVFPRGGNIDLPPLDPGMAPVTLFRLAEAYSRVLARAKISKSHEVTLERVTVRQRMEQLSLMLDERESVDFESLFLGQEWSCVEELRQMLVVTLMSVLELVKLGIMGVQQASDTETIRLQRRASYAQAMRLLSSYSEEASFGDGESSPKPAADGVMPEEAEFQKRPAVDLQGQDTESLGGGAGGVENASGMTQAEGRASAEMTAGEGILAEEAVLGDMTTGESELAEEMKVPAEQVVLGDTAAGEGILAETMKADPGQEELVVAAELAEQGAVWGEEAEPRAMLEVEREPESAAGSENENERVVREGDEEPGAAGNAEEPRVGVGGVIPPVSVAAARSVGGKTSSVGRGAEESQPGPSRANDRVPVVPEKRSTVEPLKTVIVDAAENSSESDE